MGTGGDAGEGFGSERLESRFLLWERVREPALAAALIHFEIYDEVIYRVCMGIELIVVKLATQSI
jgi:hypothetical protein